MKALRIAIVLLAIILVGCREESKVPYKELIESFKEQEELEKRNFERLVFKVSPKKVKPSLSFKFILVDQLGREWMFKTSASGAPSDGAVAIYRVFKLFGLETPEIHIKTLTINGEPLSGTVQRMITPNLGGLNDTYIMQLSPEGQAYLAKTNLLSWMTANHHIHPQQYLVLPDQTGKPNSVMRIDNSIEWFLIGNDSLAIRYQTPVLWSHARVGHAGFWRMYLNGNFDLPMREILDWAALVADFPDSFYGQFFEEGVAKGLNGFANNNVMPWTGPHWTFLPDIVPKVTQETLIPTLIKRKREFLRDVGKFFDELRTARSDVPKAEGKRDPTAEAWKLIGKLQENLHRLKAEEALLNSQVVGEQEPLILESSFKAYQILGPMAYLYAAHPRLRRQYLRNALEELKVLEETSNIETEKTSARIARRNIEKILDIDMKAGNSEDSIWMRWEFVNMNELIQDESLAIERRNK